MMKQAITRIFVDMKPCGEGYNDDLREIIHLNLDMLKEGQMNDSSIAIRS